MQLKKNAIILSAALSLLLNSPLTAESSPATLAVRGQATIRKPADELTINIGVVSRGRTAEIALKENNSKMNDLIKSLLMAGLEKGEYQTGYFNIRPIYSQRPKDAPSDWEPHIVSYEVNNSLSLQTEKIKLAGSLIDTATKSGANNINNIQFGLKNPQIYREEAIAAATKNAISDANSLSKSAGVNLVRIRTLSLEGAEAPPPSPQRGVFYAKAMAESVPVEAGNVEITTSVTITYEID